MDGDLMGVRRSRAPERCDRTWQIDALREERLGPKDVESFERHRRACLVCTAQLAHDQKLRELGRDLPVEEPAELTLRRVRARVLRDAASGPAGAGLGVRAAAAWRLAAALAVAGGLLAAWVLLGRRPVATVATVSPDASVAASAPIAGEAFAGSVIGSTAAHWKQTRVAGIERIELDAGTLRVHVRPLRAGERFLIVMPDGEIEVHGTTFDLTVTDRSTARVHVDEGIVELRLRDTSGHNLVQKLIKDDVWIADVARDAIAAPIAASSTPSSTPAPTTGDPPRPRSARSSEPRSAPASPSETPAAVSPDDGAAQYTKQYAAAMQLLRSGQNDQAAAAFHALSVGRGHGAGAQAEDASFLEAVALARAGRADAAALVAERHLAAFPASFHRKEAAVLVARAASARGDCDRARALLAPWIRATSDDGEVSAALRACRPR